MDTSKIDQLTDQIWAAQNKLLQAQNELAKLRKERNEALQSAGYQLIWQDNCIIWCHRDYAEIIKKVIKKRGFKDDIWLDEQGITLPEYATYSDLP